MAATGLQVACLSFYLLWRPPRLEEALPSPFPPAGRDAWSGAPLPAGRTTARAEYRGPGPAASVTKARDRDALASPHLAKAAERAQDGLRRCCRWHGHGSPGSRFSTERSLWRPVPAEQAFHHLPVTRRNLRGAGNSHTRSKGLQTHGQRVQGWPAQPYCVLAVLQSQPILELLPLH